MKSLIFDTINTFSDQRNGHFFLNFEYAKVEIKFIRFRKKRTLDFQAILGKNLTRIFLITQNDCYHTEFYPCFNCVTTKLKRLNAALQLRKTSLMKVNAINGTTQNLKQLSIT